MSHLKIALIVPLLVLSVITVQAETWKHRQYEKFGIQKLAIYTEAYQDRRVWNFEDEYRKAVSEKNLSWFTQKLGVYGKVNPALIEGTNYPLNQSKKFIDTEIDRMILDALVVFTTGKGMESVTVSSFNGTTLNGLLKTVDSKGYDAVLVVRYYVVKHFAELSNLNTDWDISKTSYSANVGPLQKGLAIIPSLELYDAKTGIRLWYSAYHISRFSFSTFHQGFKINEQEAFSKFFEPGSSPNTGSLQKMLLQTRFLDTFPQASENRDLAAVEQIKKEHDKQVHFNSDYRYYESGLGVGGLCYSLSYINTLQNENPLQSYLSHEIGLSTFLLTRRNLLIEPCELHIGWLAPLNQEEDNNFSYDSGTVIFGYDGRLKYLFRFTDFNALFLGATLSAEIFISNKSISSLIPFNDEYTGETWGGANISIEAGFVRENVSPFMVGCEFTPVGYGGTPNLTLKAGIFIYRMPEEMYLRNVKGDVAYIR